MDLTERRILVGRGVTLEATQHIYNYYKDEHLPSIAEDLKEKLEGLDKNMYAYSSNQEKIYQMSALLLTYEGQSYKAYLTRTMFEIVLLKVKASPLILKR